MYISKYITPTRWTLSRKIFWKVTKNLGQFQKYSLIKNILALSAEKGDCSVCALLACAVLWFWSKFFTNGALPTITSALWKTTGKIRVFIKMQNKQTWEKETDTGTIEITAAFRPVSQTKHTYCRTRMSLGCNTKGAHQEAVQGDDSFVQCSPLICSTSLHKNIRAST